ncbi:MAG: hypothetical protein M1822_009828 [Bathelium mastoideum]|nr:MAG: hypothetical protein M1822_009828 [Bathelium mastoideum]
MALLTLHEVLSREEMDRVVDTIWKAFHDPYRPDFQALHPVLGASTEDHECAMEADKHRTWQKHVNNPASHWFYVTGIEGHDVLGAAEWLAYEENPFPHGPQKMDCTWYPKGEARNFVTEMLNQIYMPRQCWMNRPHLALNQMGVHPKHRRRGIATLLMSWGMKKAGELGLESFIEASDSARFLYEKFGYRSLMKIKFAGDKEYPSDEWRRLNHEMGSVEFYAMWRPVDGVFTDEARPLWDFMQQHRL